MSKTLKTNYEIHHQIESFFTGHYLEFDSSGEHFYCAYGSAINKVCVNDGQVKAKIDTKNEDDHVIHFTTSSDDRLLIVAYSSGLIMKFNLQENSLEREFKSLHNAPISIMRIDPSNSFLATGSSDGTIKIWNLHNHYCSNNLKGINGVITNIEFLRSEDKDLLLCSGGDDSILIYNLETSKRISKLSGHCSTITGLAITPDNGKMISVGRDKLAIYWDLTATSSTLGSKIRTIPLYESVESIVIIDQSSVEQIIGRKIEKDQTFFATVGEEGLIKIWDSKTGAKAFTQNSPPFCNDRSPGHPCSQLTIRPESNQLCVVSLEKDIFIYEFPRLNLVQQLQGHLDEILSACWFAKDKYIALVCNSNDLKVIDVESSKCQHLKGHKDIVLCVASIPSEPMSLISSSKDCTILGWRFDKDTMHPEIMFSATGHTHSTHSLGVLYGSFTFFTAGEDTTLKRWSYDKNQSNDDQRPVSLIACQTIRAHEDRIDNVSVSPNDQLVATGSRDKTVKIFSVENLRVLGTLKGHRRGVTTIKFSPIDQIIVTAADTQLRLWNLNDFSCIKTFQGHDCAVLNFRFLSTGLQLLSIGSDGNMKLWDVKTNECTKTIDAHSGVTWALDMTGDDNLVLTGGQDEKLLIWKDITQVEREEKIINLQSKAAHEQDFQNYINKKRWRKALKIAIAMENQSKTLNVIREILLSQDGLEQLENVMTSRPLSEIDFIIECCITWAASAKNSSIAQRVMNILIRQLDNEQILKMPSILKSLDQMKTLTERSCNRYERLVQDSSFVDFFLESTRIQ